MVKLIVFLLCQLALSQDVTKLTVYHVNPYHLGGLPINMDTGDPAGDMYFDMSDVIIQPLECPNGANSGHGCSNPEAVAPDLVVNKVKLELLMPYSGYAMCNIGLDNNTDQYGDPCKKGTYCCICTKPGTFHDVIPCNATVGQEIVREKFSPSNTKHWMRCEKNATYQSPAYECYRSKLTLKLIPETPGNWYSTLKESYCPDGSFSANCTWRATVEKVVQKSCHNKVFYAAVESYGKDCFQACGADSTNSSSPCWTDCFYKTVLGPDAGVPSGEVTGMPLANLLSAWVKPFNDPEDGGCPPYGNIDNSPEDISSLSH